VPFANIEDTTVARPFIDDAALAFAEIDALVVAVPLMVERS